MNIVILKHTNDGRQFVFEVPAGKTLLKDDRVIVKNKNGIVDGICTCDSFEASENVVEAMSSPLLLFRRTTVPVCTSPQPVQGAVCT